MGSKRVGRGYGSGKGGHTAGRGMKGQGARSKVNILFEGTKVTKSLLRRLPLNRGKAKFKAKPAPAIITVEELNALRAGSTVTKAALIEAGIVDAREAKYGVKILEGGKLSKKLAVQIPTSKSAAKAIEKAGGTVTK